MTVKKKTKNHHQPSTRAYARTVPARPPATALLELTDWLLDHAVIAAYDDADDLDCIARVRQFAYGSILGWDAPPPSEADFLTTIALVIVAMEQRHGVTGLGEVVGQALDDATFGNPEPTTCELTGRRMPRVAPHLYCCP